jgi:hypothetical protein
MSARNAAVVAIAATMVATLPTAPALAAPRGPVSSAHSSQAVPCSTLSVLRRDLGTLSRTSDWSVVPALLDAVIKRLGVVVPRVPRIPGSTLAVLLKRFQDYRTEMVATGLTTELLVSIKADAVTTNDLLAHVQCS